MGRGTIHRIADQLQHSELEHGQRFETGEEWHGRVLENIEYCQNDIKNILQNIDKNIEEIAWHLSERKNQIIVEKNTNNQMPAWRFIVSWIFSIAIILIIILVTTS